MCVDVVVIIISGVNKLITSLSVVHVLIGNYLTTVLANVAELLSSKLLIAVVFTWFRSSLPFTSSLHNACRVTAHCKKN